MTGVLDGVIVLDLTRGVAGPMVTMMMADHGARVTRIEPPGGDPFRALPGYRVWNRGKRSAVLDLEDPTDSEVFAGLVRRADVVIESFAPGVTERLGVDYPSLAAINDRLVYCSITSYGRGARDADRPGYDALVQARTGLQWEHQGWPGGVYRLTGVPAPLGDIEIPEDSVERDPTPRPVFSATPWASIGACHLASVAVSAALYVRERTGIGQWVETSLLQGAIGASAMMWQRAERPESSGYAGWYYDGRGPKGFFECSDGRWVCAPFPSPGFVFSAASGERLEAGEGTVMPRLDPDRLGADIYELARVLPLYPRLRESFRRFPAADWVRLAAEVGVPVSDVHSPGEALAFPAYRADGCVAEIDDPDAGSLRGCGIVYHLDRSPGVIAGPAPCLGEHTDEVRAEAAAGRAAGHRRAVEPGRARPASPTPPEPPLSGIRVLDLGVAVAGPWGTQVLSDLGADVIRINAFADEFLIGHQYICAGRGKRSLAVNLKDERGRAIVHRLVAGADVVHLNIRSQAARRLGVDYDTLHALNDRLVYCHTGGYERGERADLPSNDVTANALGGTVWADGGCDAGGRPSWTPIGQGDIGNGYLSAVAVIQALYDRERTGRGQRVDTSLIYAALLNASTAYLDGDGAVHDSGRVDADRMGVSALCRLYPTAEGWLCLAAVTEEHWTALRGVPGIDDVVDNGRFATAALRAAHDRELADLLTDVLGCRGAAAWVELLSAAGVPAEVSDPAWPLRMFDDPELIRRGWVTHYDHPDLGRFDQHGLLFDFSETPGRVAGRPPMLGEHTEEILTEVGFSAGEIRRLLDDDVVRRWDRSW